mmetsp:Transcript_36513/g.85534  ORF Transcript_36513/g.85534 Transcript_36513/m.85534 type:complete len:487 (-) Transcript_36513:147-1607(-)
MQTLAERRTVLAATLAGAGVSLLAIRWLRSAKVERFRQVPGHWLLGVLSQLGPGAKFITQKIEEWSLMYGQEGVFEMNLAGNRSVVVCSWEQAHHILSRRPFKVTRGSKIQNASDIFAFLFTSEGERWKRERRVLAPPFNSKSVESHIPAIEEVAQQLLMEITKDAPKGKVDFSALLPLYSAEVVCKTALGQELQLLETRNAEITSDIKRLFQAVQLRYFSPVPYWKIPGLAWLIDNGAEISRRFDRRSEEILKNASRSRKSIAQKLMDMDGDRFTHKELLENITGLFVAGTDTTSLTTCWAFYHLARDPAFQTKVAEEVRSLPDHEVSSAQLDSFPLLQALWLETLRCHGPLTFMELEPTEPVTLVGRKLPVGTTILLALRSILRNDPEVKKELGDDLHDFRPSRWLGPEGLNRHAPFDALPFGYGPRICVGMRLADYEARLAIAKVVQRFVLEKWDRPPLIETMSTVGNQPEEPVSIGVRLRST